MARLPIDDWQFYIVTLVAIGGLWMLKRTLWPGRKGKRRKGERVNLTIEGERKAK